MSFVALALKLCTAFACNTYNVDTANDMYDCNTQYVAQSTTFMNAWNNTYSVEPLKAWLERQKIKEEPALLISYNFECIPMNGPNNQ